MNIPAGHQPPSAAASDEPSDLSAATRTASGTAYATASSHFAVHYAETATPGLPSVVFATEQVGVQPDGEWWWEYYLDAPPGAASREPLCVLRVRQRDVTSSNTHVNLKAAMVDAMRPDTEVLV